MATALRTLRALPASGVFEMRGRASGVEHRTARRRWLRICGRSVGVLRASPTAIFLQSPFRADIRLDAYQLLPLRKALRLLIEDDVGLGKAQRRKRALRVMYGRVRRETGKR
jgi:hypothetical protein